MVTSVSRIGLAIAVSAMVLGLPSIANARNSFLDHTFSEDGVAVAGVAVAPATGVAKVNGVALDSSGRTLTAGMDSSTDRFVVARYLADGTPDGAFGAGGRVAIDFGPGEYGSSVAVQPDGKILAAGSAGGSFAVARLDTNGTLDATFSWDGRITTDFGGQSHAEDIDLLPDGTIIVSGSSQGAFGQEGHFLAVAEYAPSGAIKSAFSGDGRATAYLGGSTGLFPVELAVQADGKMVASSTRDRVDIGLFHDLDAVVIRLRTNGALDTAFSGDGIAPVSFGSEWEVGGGLAIQPNGAIVGTGMSGDLGSSEITLFRLTPAGALDKSFSGDGKVRSDLAILSNGEYSAGNEVLVLPNGTIVVAGSSRRTAALLSYGTTGNPVAGPLGSSRVLPRLGSFVAATRAADGKLVVAGEAVSDGVTLQPFVARFRTSAPAETTVPTNPTISSTSHAPGVASSDVTIDATVAGATDGGSGLAGFSWIWTLDKGDNPDFAIDGDETTANFTSPDLQDGDHYLRLATVDNEGNWSEPVQIGPFRIDSGPPPLTFECRSHARSRGTESLMDLAWRETVAADVDRYRFEYTVQGDGDWRTVEAAASWRFTLRSLAAGVTYDMRISAVDAEGNVGLPCEMSRSIPLWNIYTGTKRADRLIGWNGRDRIYGFKGNDRLSGRQGGDHLFGGPGSDRLGGGFGEDMLSGDEGSDYLYGGDGDDKLVGGPGKDQFVDGAGDDIVNSRDGVRERISCGPGNDLVKADHKDVVAPNCERVRRRSPPVIHYWVPV